MAQESGPVEQAVTRALRDSLDQIQRLTDEVHKSVSDVLAACSSSRPTNSLPPMLRAQAAAASLAASLEVLARFVAGSLQPMSRAVVAMPAMEAPAPAVPAGVGSAAVAERDAGREMGSEGGPAPVAAPPPRFEEEAAPPRRREREPEPEPEPTPVAAARAEEKVEFDLKSLSSEEQELHRRANRVAKVSMQDIKMLRPEDVKQGRKNKDLCQRLKADIEKARKEYDRRFRAILEHPVDYFHDWMVDILADGDPKALGEYPYRISSPRR